MHLSEEIYGKGICALLGISCQDDISMSMMGDINLDYLDKVVFLRLLCL